MPRVLDGPEGLKQVTGAGQAAAAAMPKLTRLVGGNALLFSAVGVSYSMSKCIAEGMVGDRHPLCSAAGGVAAGVALGIHTKNLTVLMGAAAGLGLCSLAADFNGPALLQVPRAHPTSNRQPAQRTGARAHTTPARTPAPKPTPPMAPSLTMRRTLLRTRPGTSSAAQDFARRNRRRADGAGGALCAPLSGAWGHA